MPFMLSRILQKAYAGQYGHRGVYRIQWTDFRDLSQLLDHGSIAYFAKLRFNEELFLPLCQNIISVSPLLIPQFSKEDLLCFLNSVTAFLTVPVIFICDVPAGSVCDPPGFTNRY